MPGPGDRLDHYVIERALGRGGEALVFQGRDTRSGDAVVLKVLDPAQLGEVAAYERFRREVAIGRQLQHPGVPRVLEVHEEAQPPYLVLTYGEGQTLRQLLNVEVRLPLDRALGIAKSLAEVVAYCHAHGVVHRDLKPENILIRDDGVAIIDFGIALLDGAPRVTWRGFSGLVGTPEYMAPEQIRGERGGPQTDVYALGLVLYEMLAGRPPYRSANPLATMYQHLHMSATPLHQERPDVPPEIAAIVARAIRRRKEERFPTAAEFLAALANPEQVDLAVLDKPDPPLGETVRESLIRHPLVLLGAAAIVTAVLVIIAEILLRR